MAKAKRPKPFRPRDVAGGFFLRAVERCECRRKTCADHRRGHCGKKLDWWHRGNGKGRGSWEANHRNVAKGNTYSNLEILCVQCHTNTISWGAQFETA